MPRNVRFIVIELVANTDDCFIRFFHVFLISRDIEFFERGRSKFYSLSLRLEGKFMAHGSSKEWQSMKIEYMTKKMRKMYEKW